MIPFKAILLDRDGVINHDSSNYIRSLEEWQPINGSIEAIGELAKHKLAIGIVTNQSGINRGYYGFDVLHDIHEKMLKLVQEQNGYISSIRFCPHRPDEHCLCRKPHPTMILSLCRELSVLPSETLFIGDKQSDLETALAAGCHFAWIDSNFDAADKQSFTGETEPRFSDLRSLVDYLLELA